MSSTTLANESPSRAPLARSCFQARRLGHVNLWVNDIARAEAFYNQVCGLKVQFTEPGLIASFLGTGHTPHDLGMIETTKGVDRYGRDGLLQLPGTIGLRPGLNHLAWELESEAALVRGWRLAQAQQRDIDLTVDHQVAHSVYFFDPDGNYNEFYCDTIKDWRGVLQGEMDLITSHWDPSAAPPFSDGRYDDAPVLDTVPGAPVQPRRVTHAVLQTARMQEMLAFYSEVGGLTPIHEQAGVHYLRASLDSYEHALVLVPGTQAGFLYGSYELHSEAQLWQAIDQLADAGITPPRIADLPWKLSFFLLDPDGLVSEWYVNRPGPRLLDASGRMPLWAQV